MCGTLGVVSATLPVPDVRSDTETCCPSAPVLAPGPGTSRDLAGRLKALSDPTRLQLLELLAAHPGGRACICDLTAPLGVTQPTVSHHMKLLCEAGLVTREQRGRWAYYTLQPAALTTLARRLTDLAAAPGRTVPD